MNLYVVESDESCGDGRQAFFHDQHHWAIIAHAISNCSGLCNCISLSCCTVSVTNLNNGCEKKHKNKQTKCTVTKNMHRFWQNTLRHDNDTNQEKQTHKKANHKVKLRSDDAVCRQPTSFNRNRFMHGAAHTSQPQRYDITTFWRFNHRLVQHAVDSTAKDRTNITRTANKHAQAKIAKCQKNVRCFPLGIPQSRNPRGWEIRHLCFQM